ncbi:MAG TPA: hypothetical protein VG939_18355 [Caulobacteraceae bacterium]|nr:hypothetical protein [Caulobacteraceae bacterium]
MNAFAATPLLVLPALAYNIFALTLAGGFKAKDATAKLAQPLFSFTTGAGVVWPVTFADLLLGVALVVLFIELIKSTTSRRVAIINHSLSMLLFVGVLVELLLAPAFATSTFFLIVLMVLLDVLAGFIMTIVAARREVDVVNER